MPQPIAFTAEHVGYLSREDRARLRHAAGLLDVGATAPAMVEANIALANYVHHQLIGPLIAASGAWQGDAGIADPAVIVHVLTHVRAAEQKERDRRVLEREQSRRDVEAQVAHNASRLHPPST